MTYDPGSGDILLFGGYNGTSYLGDTWEFNGTTWSQVCAACGPSAREGASLEGNAFGGSVVLFGGYNGTSYLGDTWSWDGVTGTWSQVCTSGCTAPSPRAFAATPTQDAAGGEYQLVFGGYNGTSYLQDTWGWNGSSWSELDASCASPSCVLPPARADATLAWSPSLGEVLIGGYNGGYLADVWAMVGGASSITSDRWMLVCSACAPQVQGASAAYPSAGAQDVLFGGYNQAGYSGTTEAFAGATWSYLRDPTSGLPIMVTDPSGNTVSTTYTYDSSTGSPQLLETKVVSTSTSTVTKVYDTSSYMDNLCWSYPGVVGADPDNDGDYSYDTDSDSGSGQAGAGEISCSSPPAGATVYSYNSLGEMTSVTDPMGNIVSTTYASYGAGRSSRRGNGLVVVVAGSWEVQSRDCEAEGEHVWPPDPLLNRGEDVASHCGNEPAAKRLGYPWYSQWCAMALHRPGRSTQGGSSDDMSHVAKRTVSRQDMKEAVFDNHTA